MASALEVLNQINALQAQLAQLQQAAESVITSANNVVSSQGSAATRDVTESSTDTTSGRLLKVRDFGLSRNLPLPNNSVDDARAAGALYYGFSGLNPSASLGDNPFPENGGAFALFVISGNIFGVIDEYVTQIAIEIANQGAGDRSRVALFKYRTLANNNDWLAWRGMYHDGNLNVDHVSANQAGDLIMRGYVANSTTALFQRDVAGLVTSISQNSTFTVRQPGLSNTVGQSVGLDPGNCDGSLVLNVTGLSGLQTDVPCVLIADTADSEISWSF